MSIALPPYLFPDWVEEVDVWEVSELERLCRSEKRLDRPPFAEMDRVSASTDRVGLRVRASSMDPRAPSLVADRRAKLVRLIASGCSEKGRRRGAKSGILVMYIYGTSMRQSCAWPLSVTDER